MSSTVSHNEVLQLIHSHRSVRRFRPEPLSGETVEAIVRAAQAAATSHFMQAYTVINVKDPAARRQLAVLSGDQEYVVKSGAFLVWCADLYRHKLACQGADVAMEVSGTEPFLVASVDTALAAQTAMLAAESMGLGGVYIGGIRNSTDVVSRLLGLPELVYPVFGMCLGYPDESPLQRPRLPLEAVLHQDKYQAGDLPRLMEEYDAVVSDYYRRRAGGAEGESWTTRMARLFSRRRRPELDQALADRGFRLR